MSYWESKGKYQKHTTVLKKLANDKNASFSHYTTKMLLFNLINQKAKKST